MKKDALEILLGKTFVGRVRFGLWVGLRCSIDKANKVMRRESRSQTERVDLVEFKVDLLASEESVAVYESICSHCRRDSARRERSIHCIKVKAR